MEVVHFNQKQLAARWNISEASLERWRSEGVGPMFLKIRGRVLYRHVDIEAYEESSGVEVEHAALVHEAVRVDRVMHDLVIALVPGQVGSGKPVIAIFAQRIEKSGGLRRTLTVFFEKRGR